MDSPAPPASAAPLRPLDLRGAVGLILFYFALQMAVGFIATIAAGVGIAFGHGDANLLADSSALRSALTIVVVMGAALPTLWLAHRLWPELWQRAQPPGLGFARPANVAWMVLAIALGFVLPLVAGRLTEILAHGHAVPQDVKQIGASADVAWRTALAVVVVTLGPITEELLFRGLLLSALLRRMRPLAAVLVSALVFALAHLPDLHWLWYGVPNLALLGIAFAWLRLRSGSLWPAIVAHACNNLLVMATLFAGSAS